MTTKFRRNEPLSGKELERHIDKQIEVGALINFGSFILSSSLMSPIVYPVILGHGVAHGVYAQGRYLIIGANLDRWVIHNLDNHRQFEIPDHSLRQFLQKKYFLSRYKRLTRGGRKGG